MTQPAVSVILPNYNHSAFLPERLASIFAQTFEDYELILLDDCSSDDSDRVLREAAKHPKVRTYIRNEQNSGSPFKQWKKGLELARGSFVWIAESDDFCTPDFLTALVPALQEHPTCHLAGCASVYTGADGSTDERVGTHRSRGSHKLAESLFLVDGTEFVCHSMQHGNGLPNASALVIRNTPLLHSAIPTSMRYCGDWVTWIRLLARHDLILCTDVMNHWRTHPQTTRWENQLNTDGAKHFWENVDRPAYLLEMLQAMLELRPTAGRRWNTYVLLRMLEHYGKLAGPDAVAEFRRKMGWMARAHLGLKSSVQPFWIRLKSRFGL